MSLISKDSIIDGCADAFREASGTTEPVPVGQLPNRIKTELTTPMTVDTEMSDSSTNPVQNKVQKNYIDNHSVPVVDGTEDTLLDLQTLHGMNGIYTLGSYIDTTKWPSEFLMTIENNYQTTSGIEVSIQCNDVSDQVVTPEYPDDWANYVNISITAYGYVVICKYAIGVVSGEAISQINIDWTVVNKPSDPQSPSLEADTTDHYLTTSDIVDEAGTVHRFLSTTNLCSAGRRQSLFGQNTTDKCIMDASTQVADYLDKLHETEKSYDTVKLYSDKLVTTYKVQDNLEVGTTPQIHGSRFYYRDTPDRLTHCLYAPNVGNSCGLHSDDFIVNIDVGCIFRVDKTTGNYKICKSMSDSLLDYIRSTYPKFAITMMSDANNLQAVILFLPGNTNNVIVINVEQNYVVTSEYTIQTIDVDFSLLNGIAPCVFTPKYISDSSYCFAKIPVGTSSTCNYVYRQLYLSSSNTLHMYNMSTNFTVPDGFTSEQLKSVDVIPYFTSQSFTVYGYQKDGNIYWYKDATQKCVDSWLYTDWTNIVADYDSTGAVKYLYLLAMTSTNFVYLIKKDATTFTTISSTRLNSDVFSYVGSHGNFNTGVRIVISNGLLYFSARNSYQINYIKHYDTTTPTIEPLSGVDHTAPYTPMFNNAEGDLYLSDFINVQGPEGKLYEVSTRRVCVPTVIKTPTTIEVVCNTPEFTNQPTYTGVIANDFDVTGNDYYYVANVVGDTFQLTESYNGTTYTGGTFTLAGLLTGNSGTLRTNIEVEFTADGKMRLCSISCYTLPLLSNVSKIQVEVCAKIGGGMNYTESIFTNLKGATYQCFQGVGVYGGLQVMSPEYSKGSKKYHILTGLYEYIIKDTYIQTPYSAGIVHFTDNTYTTLSSKAGASINNGYIRTADGSSLPDSLGSLALYLPIRNGQSFYVTYWEGEQ